MSIKIEGLDNLQETLQRLSKTLTDKTAIAKSVANVIYNAMSDAFEGEKSAIDGKRWRPRSSATVDSYFAKANTTSR